MIAGIKLPAPGEASRFLRGLPASARQRGEGYFNAGRVSAVNAQEGNPNRFRAQVKGTTEYEVTLDYDPRKGWTGFCSCPMAVDCKHVYAAMKALLAENSAASVDRLSASAPKSVTELRLPLKMQLEQALGRRLSKHEEQFVTGVSELYRRIIKGNPLYGYEFNQFGLRWDGDAIRELLRARRLGESEIVFWNHIAYWMKRKREAIPEFMLPVTDTAEVEAEMAEQARRQQIAQWEQIIRTAVPSGPSPVNSAATVEVRARFAEETVRIEWRRPGAAEFEPMKSMQARTLRDDLANDRVQLSPEATWLWEAFAQRIDTYGSTEIAYTDRANIQRFLRFFRLPSFHPLLVNPAGQPFEFSTERLRWHLDPPDARGDYVLRMARPDGSSIPKILLVLEGHPSIYVTETAVYQGPFAESTVLSPARRNVIPGPALETKAGAELLLAYGIDLPPRLKVRVKTVALELLLSCELSEKYAPGSTELCTLRAHAVTPDGVIQQTWDGYQWSDGKQEKGNAEREDITVVDRSKLHHPDTLIGPLNARWDGYAGFWSLRVTKKFPEQFVPWLKSLPREVHVDLKGDLASLTQETVSGTLRLDVAEAGIDWFDLSVVLDIADTTLTKAEIKLLLNARGGYVRLKDKGWRRLEFKLTKEEDEQLARLGLSPRELSGEPQRLHALQLADTAAKKFLPPEQFERVERRASDIKARVTPALPGTVSAQLRPYQQEGFHFLAYLTENRFGGILADDMGLGKTLQTLTWMAWLRERTEKPGPSLVVCPKSVTDNWRAEVERFTPTLKVKVWHADELPKMAKQLKDFDLHVLNYNQLRSLGESLTPTRWHAVILDEGQYIKNPSSITAQVARALKADHRLVLSGTPIENRLMDLWSLMSFAMPGVLGSRAQFGKLYDAKEDPFARRRLSARVRPFLLRRTKSQVAKDLPDRIEEDILCELEGEQKTLYRAELKRAQQMLLGIQTQKQLAKEQFNFLTSLLRLRQICCHPRLVKDDSKAPSAKVEALLEQLEPLIEEGQKVLVFSQFVQMLDLLRTEIEAREWRTFYLAGDTENRGELVKEFQSAEGPGVFLISLKAGGFGLNLTAASYVVLFDPWWNPAVENQAIDRTHRIGQTENVIAYRLLIKDSIEEKIRTLQRTKSALADDVLGEEKFAQSLTLDDLRFLFSDM